jgi:hypothetical protein
LVKPHTKQTPSALDRLFELYSEGGLSLDLALIDMESDLAFSWDSLQELLEPVGREVSGDDDALPRVPSIFQQSSGFQGLNAVTPEVDRPPTGLVLI